MEHELQPTAPNLDKSSCGRRWNVRYDLRNIVQRLATFAIGELIRTPACLAQCRLLTGDCRGG